MIKILDGSYVNPAYVTRYFVDFDVTASVQPYSVKLSINGPQMPFVVERYETEQSAYEALDMLVYRLERIPV